MMPDDAVKTEEVEEVVQPKPATRRGRKPASAVVTEVAEEVKTAVADVSEATEVTSFSDTTVPDVESETKSEPIVALEASKPEKLKEATPKSEGAVQTTTIVITKPIKFFSAPANNRESFKVGGVIKILEKYNDKFVKVRLSGAYHKAVGYIKITDLTK